MVKTVLYISMLCEKGSVQDEVTCRSPELGDASGQWLDKRLEEHGVAGEFQVSYLNIAQGDTLPAVGAIPPSPRKHSNFFLSSFTHQTYILHLTPKFYNTSLQQKYHTSSQNYGFIDH